MNQPPVTHRYRLDFRKEGDLRWIGHHDLARTVERLFRRLELPFRMSQGFHPKPKIRFPSALALGIASRVEWVEVELEREVDLQQLLADVQTEAPAGLVFTRAAPSSGKMPQLATATYAIEVPPPRLSAIKTAVARLWESHNWSIMRAGKTEPVDLRQGLLAISLENNMLQFTVAAGRRGAVRPREVLAALEADDLESLGVVLVRTSITFDADHASSHADEPADDDLSHSDTTAGLDPHVLKSLDQPSS